MSRYIDIEPYEKDGWYLQRRYRNSYGESIETAPLVSVPTADVEPIKHGRWITEPIQTSARVPFPMERCSVCDRLSIERTNYCPNCGARMDGGEK